MRGALCVALIISGMPARVWADTEPATATARVMTLNSLLQEVRAGNPEIAAARQELEAAQQRIASARALDDPMLELGVAKELARLVLPPTIYSEAYWTVSLQAVLHFLDQRLAPEAQFEIRSYAQGVLELIRPDLNEMGVEL